MIKPPGSRQYFPSVQQKFGVLTCGGVCPGMNDVVRSITLNGFRNGVKHIHGIKYGFQGLHNQLNKTVKLDPCIVQNIHKRGGSFLGTSRTKLDPARAITTLLAHNITTLFVIGGNGGNTAAANLHDALQIAKIPIQIIGLPKSIDNDIDIIDKCFGFETAVAEANYIMQVARNEAEAVPRGIAVVKVMGRNSGFIAHATTGATIKLIPERPLSLQNIVLQVNQVVDEGRACVICIAEGFPIPAESLVHVLKERVFDCYVKYIDPSYILRGGTTTNVDHQYCNLLGAAAVQAALEGFSGITVATYNEEVMYFRTRDIVTNVKKVKF